MVNLILQRYLATQGKTTEAVTLRRCTDMGKTIGKLFAKKRDNGEILFRIENKDKALN
jgi:hypothetical protein